MKSLNKDGKPYSMMLNTGKSAAAPTGPQGPNLVEQQRSEQIASDSLTHPNDALANAAALSPRYALQTYVNIANNSSHKNSSITEAALARAQDLVEKIPPMEQMSTVTEII